MMRAVAWSVVVAVALVMSVGTVATTAAGCGGGQCETYDCRCAKGNKTACRWLREKCPDYKRMPAYERVERCDHWF